MSADTAGMGARRLSREAPVHTHRYRCRRIATIRDVQSSHRGAPLLIWIGNANRVSDRARDHNSANRDPRDPPLERWWSLGEARRRSVIRALIASGVALATAPNYSLILNRPRWDDLHAIKRIGLVHYEFLDEGLPAALHINGRTDADFFRWTDYLIKRPEITHVAYEFRTMSGRQEAHVEWLIGVAGSVGRPLHLIMRGGTEYLLLLSAASTNITFLDTTVFMKTVNRQRAYRTEDGGVDWKRHLTKEGAPLDKLLSGNASIRAQWLTDLAAMAAK